jgi:hypothetical protein
MVVQDQLPAGLIYVSATPSQGAYDLPTANWNAGTLPAGATMTLVMAATVTADGSVTNTATIVSPSMVKLSSLNGGALPPGVTIISSATTTTASSMATSCFGASFNFASANHDKLLFTSKLPLPNSFKPNGQSVSFALSGLNYSCVLNQHGQSRIGGKLVQLRPDRGGWVIMLRVSNDNLKQIKGVVNETVKSLRLSGMSLRVSVGGKNFVSKPTTFYTAIQNQRGVIK